MSSLAWAAFAPEQARGGKRLLLAVGIATLGAGCALIYIRDPAGGGYPVCPFRAVTGLWCPGCGTMRGLHQILHANVARATDLNPLMVLMLPVMIYSLVSAGLVAVAGRGLPRFFVPAWAIRLLAGAVVVFWVLRNIPVAPFSYLAP